MRAIRFVRAAVIAAVAAFALAAASLGSAGCDSGEQLKLCGEIPADGCPIGRGGTCDDAFCRGLYDCVDGKWTLEVDCSTDGGASTSSGSSGSGGSGGSAACTPIAFSHAGELLGCTPDLQSPDCPAAVAEGACAETVCLVSECVDFYLCVKDDTDPVNHRSWSAVGTCDENYNFVVFP